MKKINLVIMCLLLLLSFRANAIIISLVPSANTVTVGQTVSVDVLAELESGEANLALYDLFINWDNAFLSLVPLDLSIFGTALGGPADSIQDVGLLGPNNVFESTFLFDATDLEALQITQPFRLFTFELTALAATSGTVVSLSESQFGGFLDFDGNLLTGLLGQATIAIEAATTPNPVNGPTAWLLLMSGLLFVFTKKRSKR